MASRSIKWLLGTIVVVAIAAGIASSLSARQDDGSTTGKVFGLPEAQVFTENYDGPPVVGDTVSLAPNVAPLKPGNRTHDVRIDILAREVEIAPGVRYLAWTFGGSVPGPILHVREGDRVNFVMKNRTGEQVSITAPGKNDAPFLAQIAERDAQHGSPALYPMPHSIDFHAGTVAPNDKWRIIQPGESIRFQWVANYPGVFTYHCGGAPVLQHVAMGQYGIVIVSPKDGFPTDRQVAREYAVVQSEFYLKPGDDPEGNWVFDMDAATHKAPSQIAFNGHVKSMSDAPLLANAGERVRLYVHNVGPNDQTSFHVIGTILDRVYYEGNPRNAWFGMQTVPLGASNGAVVEFIVPEEGDYPFVDHEFADALKGAVGHIRVRGKNGAMTKPMPEPMKH